jgi:photosystem II stability/assembly factor-like uncharacterized protein
LHWRRFLPTGEWVVATAADGANRGHLYVATLAAGGLAIWASSDTGTTWRRVAEGDQVGFDDGLLYSPPRVLVADPGVPSTLYLKNLYGTWKSTDGGASWRPFEESLSNPPVALVDASHCLLMDRDQDLARTCDGGVNWEYPIILEDEQIAAVAESRSDPSLVYAASFITGVRGPHLWRSHDGGATFERLETPLPGVAAIHLVVDPRSAETVYVGYSLKDGGGGGILRRGADGAWDDLSSNLFDTTVNAVAFDLKAQPRLVVATPAGLRAARLPLPH